MFYQNYLVTRNTADVIGGKPITATKKNHKKGMNQESMDFELSYK
jgi:hypothetical protein